MKVNFKEHPAISFDFGSLIVEGSIEYIKEDNCFKMDNVYFINPKIKFCRKINLIFNIIKQLFMR